MNKFLLFITAFVALIVGGIFVEISSKDTELKGFQIFGEAILVISGSLFAAAFMC